MLSFLLLLLLLLMLLLLFMFLFLFLFPPKPKNCFSFYDGDKFLGSVINHFSKVRLFN